MFKTQTMKVAEVIAIDKALEDVIQQSMKDSRLAYKLGRFKGYTERIRTNAEKAQQDLFRTLGTQHDDGRITVPKEKSTELQNQIDLLNEAEEKLRVPTLKISEIEACGVYLKPSFYQAMNDLVELDEAVDKEVVG